MSMTLIRHIEVDSSTSSVTFMSVGDIPSDYTDLLLVGSARSSRSTGVDDDLVISFNGSTANFTMRRLFGTGSGRGSLTTPDRFAGYLTGNTATSNTFSSLKIYIPNYRSSTAKAFSTDSVSENNAAESYQAISAGLWNDTSAITSITLASTRAEDFLTGTSFTLYGITKGSDGTTTVS